ncbi:hypothetical protein ACFV3R_31390 [Streptomyces sp. NPDC059740]|uniref:hypothetical protein n=1 Tax=Streptomyces sp. NPDC059740 TaxID=3346926 RepID=UPI003647461A
MSDTDGLAARRTQDPQHAAADAAAGRTLTGPADDGAGREAGSGGRWRPWPGGGRQRRSPGPRGGRTWRVVRRTALGLVLLLVLTTATAGLALRLLYRGEVAADTSTRGRDALWLGHAWVDGRHDEADVRALLARTRGTGLRDLYVHTGPLEHDGTLPPGSRLYPRAGWFLSAVHRLAPALRVHAWLGDKLTTGPGDGAAMDLADPATRRAVLASTRQVLDAGFAGVHFDLEPLASGDPGLLRLLDEVRPVLHARRALLSVSVGQIDPVPAAHTLLRAGTGHVKWVTQDYFGQVARRVDQIALMTYDTALPLESLYGGYVAHQTRLALAATGPGTDLLMGVPFYHDENWGHHASAETVRATVRGVRLGLTRDGGRRSRFGLALYVDYAATATDWAAYRNGWGRVGAGAS